MTTNWNLDPNKYGVNGFGSQVSDLKFSVALVANADTTVAVPLTIAMGAPTAPSKNKFLAVMTCTPSVLPIDDVFFALNVAATVPVAAVGGAFVATNSDQLPTYLAKQVKSGDVLHFISGGTPNVTVAFYAIQE